jgi:hypothetical protein
MTRLFVALLLILCAGSMPLRNAWAIDTPRQLARYCERLEKGAKGSGDQVQIPNTKEALLCWGYMSAMQDISVLANKDGSRIMGACPPEESTLLELVHSYVVYARSHRGKLGENTAVAVIRAFQEAYPCARNEARSIEPAER